MPRPDFLRGELRSLVLGVLDERSVKERGLFRPAAVRALLDHFYRTRPSRELWTASLAVCNQLILELWLRRHVDGLLAP